MRERTAREWLEALAGRAPTPAAGSLAYLTLAGCAALAAKLAELAGEDRTSYLEYSKRFLLSAEADAREYRPGDPIALGAELDRLEEAYAFVRALGDGLATIPPGASPDLAAARSLANAALEVLRNNARVNKRAVEKD